MTTNGTFAKLYYAGPMFRYERPQAGRMRQFWQIGLEALGMPEPTVDVEVIAALMAFFGAMGLPADRMTLLVNSMGDETCRPAYRDAVADHIRANAADLCEECVRRAETNPLRAFDCKNESCRPIMAAAPLITDHLCEPCREHYAAVKSGLDALQIPYTEDPRLVRGLDYYTRTVFEVQAEGLGAQNAIGGGGRYDRLMEQFGGAPTPGLGFALGFERTLLALQAAEVEPPAVAAADVYVAAVDDAVRAEVFSLAMRLRAYGLSTDVDHQARSLKSQLKVADRIGAKAVVIVGPDEVEAGEATVRDMFGSTERRIPLAQVPGVVHAIVATA
jgi:histidyl-tRNA synthetase